MQNYNLAPESKLRYMKRDEILSISNAMIKYGGSFASNLGRALLVADSENTKKILAAFPELISQYKRLTDEA